MATVVRWDPWRELAGVERRFDELFGRGRAGARTAGSTAWAPALDVHQDGDTMVIRAEVPGVAPDDVDVTIDDNVLTISGQREDDRTVEEGQWIRRERVSGQFRRSISLPPGVDPNKVKATADNGVVEIRVPRPSRNEPHRVELSGGGNGKQQVDVGSSAMNASSEERQATSEERSGTGQRSRATASSSTSRGKKTTKATRTR